MPKPRKRSVERPHRTLRIYCEGAKTEPQYLKAYIATLDTQNRKSVIEVEDTRKNTPVQLVEEAIRAKSSRESLPGDEFWVVYDRESPAKYPDSKHAEAMTKARAAGVRVAITNVCFEYWLLLHFAETSKPYECYEDLRKNSALNDGIKNALGCDYEKASRRIFSALEKFFPVARQRATNLNERARETAPPGKSEPYHMNPYIGFVDLLDAIDNFE